LALRVEVFVICGLLLSVAGISVARVGVITRTCGSPT
jgi:hypothetical protein